MKSLAFVLLLVSSLALAGGSTINSAIPATNSALQSAPIRANFQAAQNDINNLIEQNFGISGPVDPLLGQLWLNSTGTPYVLNVFDGTDWVAYGTLNASTHAYQNYSVPWSGVTSTPTTLSGYGITNGVSSVSLTVPSFLSVTGSPITGTGTFVVTTASEAPGLFLASPASTTGPSTMRAIAATDVPALNQNTTGTSANVTGTVAIANGGTNLTSIPTNGQIDIGNGTGFTRSTLTAGSNVTITNASGAVTIAAAGGAAWSSLTAPTANNSVTATVDTSQTLLGHFDTSAGMGQALMTFGEDLASTKTGSPTVRPKILQISTVAGSTASPLWVSMQGQTVMELIALSGSFVFTGLTDAITGASAGGVVLNGGTSASANSAGVISLNGGTNSSSGSGGSVTLVAGPSASGTNGIVSLAANNATQLQVGPLSTVSMPNLAQSSSATTGTVCWTTGGNLTVDTTLACLSSSKRYKNKIDGLAEGLGEIMKLRPVHYELKPEHDPMHLGEQVGLIAEEVHDVDPRLVGFEPDGKVRGVRYMQLTAVLVKGMQDQQNEIKFLFIGLGVLGFLFLTSLIFALKKT